MKFLLAFIRKEVKEQLRSGRLLILAILFVLFGVMNPAVAKLTPWLFEMMSDSLAEIGMTVTAVTVNAMDSWVQFFKNMPIALIAFVLLESSIFTREYQTGTLVLSLTKGLERYKVVVSKTIILVALWTVCYWLCFGITYGYTAYFWDNSVAQNMMFSVVCWWLFGIWIVSLTILFSTILNANTSVLVATVGVVFVSYLLGLLPRVSGYLPTQLTDGNSLIYGAAEIETYIAPFIITAVASVVCISISIPIFNKKLL